MKKSQKQAMAVGAGITALAAAAAGVYMMTGKNAKNRKKVSAWAGKMQKDVVKQLGSAEKASQAVYNKVVDSVAQNYQGLKNVNALELAAVAGEMKNHWNSIRGEMQGAAGTIKRISPTTKKTAPRKVAVKKVAAKSAAKKR